MRPSLLSSLLFTLAIAFSVSCKTITPSSNYTKDYNPRDGQVIWFTPDEINVTIRLVASCISASEMATEFHRASRKYAEYIRLCYYNISQNNVDVDAGIRGINFIKRLHLDAEGSSKLWNETIKLAKEPESPHLLGKPIPQDYN